jgi:hypothetical protein
MHLGHDHDEGGGSSAAPILARGHASIGDNGHRDALQWQTPHRPDKPPPSETRDLDQIETAFAEAFVGASDPVSLLRLAGIPMSGRDGSGGELHLLRVEIEALTDVGALSPLFGGGLRYEALRDHLVSRRRRLHFIYFDGTQSRRLALSEARSLAPTT